MSQRKQIYFTSDLHIGHANSITYDQRPFTDLNHMHRVLINNFNACVPPNGICYFIGDIGMSDVEYLKKFISKLNGTKILILGNHDRGYNAMYGIGFDAVIHSATMYIAGQRVTLSHCPLHGIFREDVVGMRGASIGENWHGEWKNQAYSVEDEGQYHLHGHVHSGVHNGKPRSTHNQFDVGVVHNNYRPVSISVIESWIALEEKKKQGKLNE